MNVFFYPNSDIVALVERVTSPSTGYSVLNTHDLVLRHCCKAGIQSNSQWQCQRCVIKAWVLSQNRLFIFFHNQMVLLLNQFVQRVTHLLWLRSRSISSNVCGQTSAHIHIPGAVVGFHRTQIHSVVLYDHGTNNCCVNTTM